MEGLVSVISEQNDEVRKPELQASRIQIQDIFYIYRLFRPSRTSASSLSVVVL